MRFLRRGTVHSQLRVSKAKYFIPVITKYLASIDTLNFPLLLPQESVMNKPTSLSLEQEFQLKSFADQVQRMSREQAQEFLIMIHRQMMIKEKMYQNFIKQEWNLD